MRGMSLVELLVAMTIGIFLIGGALSVYIGSRATLQINESVARMQEHARFALDTLEPDLRLANYWGLHNWASVIERSATHANPLTNDTAVLNDCDVNWAIDVETPIEGSNGVRPDWGCLAAANYRATTDVLAVRHASEETVATGDIQAGRVYVRSDESPRGMLFANAEPGGFSAIAENHELVTNAYYIRPFSFDAAEDPQIPSLRRLILADGGADPQIQDREVITGVDDMQMQIGIDTTGDSSANRYVNPDNPLVGAPGVQPVAVRIWLLMRSNTRELDFEDSSRYAYADVDFFIDDRADMPQGYRRLLVSRTIMLRNL